MLKAKIKSLTQNGFVDFIHFEKITKATKLVEVCKFGFSDPGSTPGISTESNSVS